MTVYCVRRSSVVGLSVGHFREPCKNGGTDQDNAIWSAELGVPKEACIRWVSRSDETIRDVRGDKLAFSSHG